MPGHVSRVRSAGMQLSRDVIAEAAVRILDEYGLADVSMRRVAGQLGVAPGALYWHVENKQALVSAMAELILSPVRKHSDPREMCSQIRAALLSHRDGADVVMAAVSQPHSPLFASLVKDLRATLPHSDPRADAAAEALLFLTLGAANIYQSGAQLQDVAKTPGTPRGESVDTAVDLLLLGLGHSPDSVNIDSHDKSS